MNAKVAAVQTVLGVTPVDGIYGPITQAAWDAQIRLSAQPPPTEGLVDARSEKAIATLHPKVQPLARLLIQKAAAQDMHFKITSGFRTYEEQDALYEQGRSKPGVIVTNARGGFSSHNFATAFDVTLFKGTEPVWDSVKYVLLGSMGKQLGLSWGGDWSKPDEPHYYLKPWPEMSESQMMSELRRRHDNHIDAFA